MPFQKWFLAISLILNAKNGISTRQLARNLALSVKTAWSVGVMVRKVFEYKEASKLKGIFEMNETYIKKIVKTIEMMTIARMVIQIKLIHQSLLLRRRSRH